MTDIPFFKSLFSSDQTLVEFQQTVRQRYNQRLTIRIGAISLSAVQILLQGSALSFMSQTQTPQNIQTLTQKIGEKFAPVIWPILQPWLRPTCPIREVENICLFMGRPSLVSSGSCAADIKSYSVLKALVPALLGVSLLVSLAFKRWLSCRKKEEELIKNLYLRDKLKKNYLEAQKQLKKENDNPKWEKKNAFANLSLRKSIEFPDLNCAVFYTRGKRTDNQDQYVVGRIHKFGIPVYGVFDGFNGVSCAEYLSKNFLPVLDKLFSDLETVKLINRNLIISNILKRAISELDSNFKLLDKKNCGSTANLALLIDGVLWVANVGDSRAILVEGSHVYALSEDASLKLKKYRNQVIKNGGEVTTVDQKLRVGKKLDFARAMGIKIPGVLSKPMLVKKKLIPHKNYALVLATDGLWKAASSNQVAKTVQLLGKRWTPHGVAMTLVKQAYNVSESSKRDVDNITVLAVQIKT